MSTTSASVVSAFLAKMLSPRAVRSLLRTHERTEILGTGSDTNNPLSRLIIEKLRQAAPGAAIECSAHAVYVRLGRGSDVYYPLPRWASEYAEDCFRYAKRYDRAGLAPIDAGTALTLLGRHVGA